MWHELLVCGMAIVGTMGTARSKGECVTHAKSLILKVVGSQQLASIFCRKLLLAPPKPQNFPAARAQGGGLRPGSATLTATIIHARSGPPVNVQGPPVDLDDAKSTLRMVEKPGLLEVGREVARRLPGVGPRLVRLVNAGVGQEPHPLAVHDAHVLDPPHWPESRSRFPE